MLAMLVDTITAAAAVTALQSITVVTPDETRRGSRQSSGRPGARPTRHPTVIATR